MRFAKFAKRNRVVLDTNVIVSGLINPVGSPSRVLQYLVTGIYELLVSEEIYQEYAETLEEFSEIRSHIRRKLLKKIKFYATWIHPAKKLKIIHRDPEDNKFLECALEGRARYIVTGDPDLLELGKFREIRILKVVEFLRMLDLQITSIL